MADLRILPRVYEVAGPHLTVGIDCSCFLIKDDPAILIDCGTPDGIPVMEKNLASVGMDFSQVEMLIGTHCHYDHIAGAAAIKELAPVTLCMHQEAVQGVESGDGKTTVSEIHYRRPFPPVKVDRVLNDGDVILLKNSELAKMFSEAEIKGTSNAETGISQIGTVPFLKALLW